MSRFLDALRSGPVLADGAMGSYLFERTGRVSETNHVYEALSADNPELVREAHFAYLQAGARCLTTNTFGANRANLAALGEGGRVQELNRAAVRLARGVIEEFRRETSDEDAFFVLGSIGPLAGEDATPAETTDAYRDQVSALAGEGVDALVLETFTSLAHVRLVLELVRELDDPPPVIVQMALEFDGEGSGWNQDPGVFVEMAAGLGADVVGVNCCAPWEAAAFVDAVRELDVVKRGGVLVSAMPNVGGYQRIGHRYMTRVNPEYLGSLARDLSERGASLVGGCCEVHPDHVVEMAAYLRGAQAGRAARVSLGGRKRTPAGPESKKANGGFSRKIMEGKFAVSVEILPARGTSPRVLQSKVGFIEELAGSGLADALDITDGSRGIPLMPPGDFIAVVRERLGWNSDSGDGLELIPHFTARDLNVMGLQSRLVGYHSTRIHNVVFITGDPPKMSPTYPRSTPVFDLDSVSMIRYAHACLNAGVDFGGQPLGRQPSPGTHFTIGSGFEPEAANIERELEKLRRKIDAGVDYIMTQPAFRPEPLDVLTPFRSEVPILVGVMVLGGIEHAQRVGRIPGVSVPQQTYDRLGAFEALDDQASAAREIAVEQVRSVRDQGWAGLYLMSPASHRPVTDVLREGLG